DVLPGDAYPVGRLAHAAFEHVAHAELTPDLLQVHGPPLVGEARIARDHEQPTHARQRGYDVFGHPVNEVFLLGIAAHVLEGKHRDRRLVGQRRRRAKRNTAEANVVGADRLRDVLELTLADVVIRETGFPADFLIDLAGNADATRLRQPLESRSDIDTV